MSLVIEVVHPLGVDGEGMISTKVMSVDFVESIKRE